MIYANWVMSCCGFISSASEPTSRYSTKTLYIRRPAAAEAKPDADDARDIANCISLAWCAVLVSGFVYLLLKAKNAPLSRHG